MGRDSELNDLQAWLEAVVVGHGCVVLVSGEPGIGKSRLADEFASRARDREVEVLWGRCWEAGGAPAYWPWVQVLRTYLKQADGASLREDMGLGVTDIAQILPELRELFPDVGESSLTETEAARFRLFDATTRFLKEAARRRPLLLVLEDLHAADTPSLLLLRFLAREISDGKVMALGAYRDMSVDPDHPLVPTVAELMRETTTRRVDLTGLDHAEIATFIEEIGGSPPTPALVRAIREQTGGNPLFAGEIVRLLVSEGRLEEAGHATPLPRALPRGIIEVIEQRIRGLSPGCREVLEVASVLGREFDLELLSKVLGRSVPDLTEVLDEAIQRAVISEVPRAIARLRFSHSLVRDTLYDALPRSRRLRLHLDVGRFLLASHQNPDPYLAEIAHHFFQSAPAGDAAEAAHYARRAGKHAATQLAYEEAVRLYRMALQATELEESADEVARCDLLLELGDAQMRAGETPGAKETFLGAASIARRLGMPEHLARAALGYGGRFVWARAANDRYVIPLLEDALNAVGEKDTVLRARLLARLSGALRDQPTPEQRESLSREAVEVARKLEDPATLAYALDGRYSAIWAPDTTDERLQIADEIVQIAEATKDMERASQGHHYRLAVFMEHGDIPAVQAELERNARLADELRQPAQSWYVRATAAILSLLQGRFEDAERLITEAFDEGRQAENVHAVGVSLLQRYLVRREQGRASEMEDELRSVMDEFSFWPWMRCALLHLYAELDRKAEARSLFEAIAVEDFRNLPWDNDWLMGVPLLAEVAVSLRDVQRASSLYELLRPYADRNTFGHPEFCMGSASRPLGLLAVTLGRLADAERHFADAVAMNERMGARPWTAHTRCDYGTMLLGRDGPGDRERAEELFQQARATARELGMVALEGKIQALAGEDAAPVPAGSVPPRVFRREGEYFSVAFGGQAFRLRDAKGLRHLARLLAAPGQEFHALDLVRMEEGGSSEPIASASELEASGPGDAGAVLDPQAKAAYRRRLDDLQEELEEAQAFNDPERAARARQEMEFLTQELAGAVGLSGRDRRAASAAERARVNVTRAIKSALARIAEHHPALGEHFETTVHTGTFCSYIPDSTSPATWQH